MAKIDYIFFALVVILVFFLVSRNKVESKEIQVEEMITPQEQKLTWVDSLVVQYDSIITQSLEETGTVGAAIAIVYKDTILFLKCYGVKKEGGQDPIDENTIFRLASVSKSVTGIFSGIMAKEGVINLDDKIIDYLPDFRLKDSINTYNLTIRNILSHTTGLLPHAYDNLVEAKVDFKTIMDSMFRVDISGKPGELYSYQNVMFSFYDTISTIKTSKSYGSLLKEKLFAPYQMTNASSGFEAFVENDNKAYPHTRVRNGYSSISLNDRYYNTIPAAGINASVSDMAHLLLHLFYEDSIHSNLLDTVFKPQVYTPLSRSYFRQWGKVDSRHYGLGWRIVGYRGRTIAYHGGYVLGYRAELALCREEKIGIVYLSNSPSTTSSISVPTFLNLFFDYKEKKKTNNE